MTSKKPIPPRQRTRSAIYTRKSTEEGLQQDFNTLGGKVVYLGKHGTPESRDKYQVALAEWISRGSTAAPDAQATPAGDPAAVPTVSTIIAAYLTHADGCMRAGKVLSMRPIDINTTGKLWEYRPATHKMQHDGHHRAVYLGDRAQAILRPYLVGRPTYAFLFSPAEAEAERRALASARRAERGTPLFCGNRPGTNRKANPARRPGERYAVVAYAHAIWHAADRADAWAKGGLVVGNDERVIPRWHAHQLRHNVYDALGRLVRTDRYQNLSIGIGADLADGLFTTAAPTAEAMIGVQAFATTSTVYDKQGRVLETVDASGLRSGRVYYDSSYSIERNRRIC